MFNFYKNQKVVHPIQKRFAGFLLPNALLLILLGVAILVNPDLLATIVAFAMIFFGANLLMVWWRNR